MKQHRRPWMTTLSATLLGSLVACATSPDRPSPEPATPPATARTESQPSASQEAASSPAAVAPVKAAARPVRLSWQEFAKDPNRVASFRKAVQVMKQRNALPPSSMEFRTSWNYWANIHGYLGPNAKKKTKAEYIKTLKERGLFQPGDERFFEGISDQTPPDALAQKVWDQCPHGTQAFFPWHRLYLFYFERVLRAAAGDDTLRLPYWDYTDPKQVAMLAEFTQPTYTDAQGTVLPNPLHDARRAAQQFSLDPQTTNVNDWLAQGDYANFWPGIERNVHGYVHCTVNSCPLPFMGAVALSSNDPIFWLHHANIDRLWTCWLSEGHENPAGAFQQASFSFVNENGEEVTHQVRDLFGPTSIIDYTYDHETSCARAVQQPVAQTLVSAAAPTSSDKQAAAATPSAPVDRPEVIGRSTKEVKITGPVSRQTLDLPERGQKTLMLQGALAVPGKAPSDVELVLDGIEYAAHPGTMFNVILEKKDDPTKRQYVGTLSFFSAPLYGDEEHHHHDNKPAQQTFDVTEELRALVGPGLNIQDVNVVFEATTGQAGATPEKSMARFNKQANLRVKNIELRVKPTSR